MDKQNKKILIVGGGTGGHIMPALSIAESLKAQEPTCQVEFVHGPTTLEKDIYARSFLPSHILSVGRLRKNVSKKERIKTLITLPLIMLKALNLIIKIKPSLILGTGGAVSGPVLLAGALLRKKTILFEPNAVPGLSNRCLFPFVHEAWLVFESAKKYFKPQHRTKYKKVSFPVRPALAHIPVKTTSQLPLKVLILGGSQGSALINKVVSELICSLTEKEHGQMSFVHQTGQKEFEHYKKVYYALKDVQVLPFLHEIHQFYAWSDVVVGRAGAGFLAELSAVQRAGILIPLHNSADQHQLKNAQFLEKVASALVIEEKAFNKNSLKQTLQRFITEPEKVKTLASHLHQLKLGVPANQLASSILG